MVENNRVANVGWVSLSQSRRSLTIRVMGELFFVPLRDLDAVLEGRRSRTVVKKWVVQRTDKEWEEKLKETEEIEW